MLASLVFEERPNQTQLSETSSHHPILQESITATAKVVVGPVPRQERIGELEEAEIRS